MIKIFTIITIFSTTLMIGQNANQAFIEIGIINETPLKQIMADKYEKKIYKSDEKIYSVKESNSITEIIEYHSDKTFSNFYFIKDENLYKVSDYEYIDRSMNEITAEQQEMMKDLYTIYKDSTKTIANLECFKVVMKVQGDDSTSINMFVSKDIPNLPNHFPLASNVLNAEPLEIDFNLMGSKVIVGIVNFKENRSIEDDYDFNFEKALTITFEEYQQKRI